MEGRILAGLHMWTAMWSRVVEQERHCPSLLCLNHKIVEFEPQILFCALYAMELLVSTRHRNSLGTWGGAGFCHISQWRSREGGGGGGARGAIPPPLFEGECIGGSAICEHKNTGGQAFSAYKHVSEDRNAILKSFTISIIY